MLTADRASAILDGQFTDLEIAALAFDWPLWARPNQLAPAGDWTVWLRMAGRGEGKTRSGAEFVRAEVEAGRAGRVALVAPTASDARDVMVEGESGLLAVCPPWMRPTYEPSKRRLTWPNGAMAVLYSAEEPDRLRGPQHDLAWADEVAAWERPDTWDQLMLGLRLGVRPRVVATTTPKPVQLVRDIIGRSDCIVSRGATRDNIDNLAEAFLRTVVKRYEGTRLGRQELDGELLEDNPGALWTRSVLEDSRLDKLPCEPSRIVIGVDPAVTSHEESDETGIIVACRGSGAARDHFFVLEDRSGLHHATQWPREVVAALNAHKAERIVGEVNNGGDLVEAAIRQVPGGAYAPFESVHATRGKAKRAEPVAMLWEQGRAHLVGSFARLEDQCCTYRPDDPTGKSPDRMDAMVWAITALMVECEVWVV
jgi:phage terminase large subunit-like protein